MELTSCTPLREKCSSFVPRSGTRPQHWYHLAHIRWRASATSTNGALLPCATTVSLPYGTTSGAPRAALGEKGRPENPFCVSRARTTSTKACTRGLWHLVSRLLRKVLAFAVTFLLHYRAGNQPCNFAAPPLETAHRAGYVSTRQWPAGTCQAHRSRSRS